MKDFFKIGVIYSLAKYIAMGLGVIKSFFIAGALGPTFLGSYAVVILITEYLNYTNLGVFASMNRDVAIYLQDKDKEDYVKKVQNTALSFSIVPVTAILISFLILDFLEVSFLPPEMTEYSMIILILVAIYQLKMFTLRYLRLYSKYYELTVLELSSQIINLTGVILFVDQYSIDAVLWSVIISNIFFVIASFFYVTSINFRLDYKLTKYLITSGFPMLLYGIILTLLSSADRIVLVASFENRISLGLYQFGFVGAQGLFMAFNSVTFLFYPRWLKYLHQGKESFISKFEAIKDQTHIIELLLVCLSIFGIVLIPYFIDLFLPDYKTSILISQFLLLAYISNGLTFVTSTYLISNNHQIKIVPIVSFVVLIAFLMNYLFIWLGYGLYGIAFSTIIAFFVYAMLITRLTLKLLGALSWSNFFDFFKRLFLLVPVSVFLLYEQYNVIWIILIFFIIYFNLARDLGAKAIKLYRESKTT